MGGGTQEAECTEGMLGQHGWCVAGYNLRSLNLECKFGDILQ